MTRPLYVLAVLAVLVVVALLYIKVLIPNYRECLSAGFSKTYCGKQLYR